MAPYSTSTISTVEYKEKITYNVEKEITTKGISKIKNHIKFFKELKWFNIILITTIHAIFAWGLFAFPYRTCYSIFLFNYLLGIISGIGVTVGVHRYWTHRSFKAKLPLQIFLMLCYCLTGHNPIFNWVRDHRVHHKFTDTDADPHNSKRGFFFSHAGWLMMKKHPEVTRRGKDVDMSDILNDPVIKFHQKYYVPLVLTIGFIIPTIIPPLCWGQSWKWSFLLTFVGRYCILLNTTWSVNSAAHLWGTKPYDKKLSATENAGVSLFTQGEGWHNYHHIFPWSYKSGEYGRSFYLNSATIFIEMFAKMGLAYDLRSPSKGLIKIAVQKAGDGTHPEFGDMEISEDCDGALMKEDPANKID